MTRLAAGRRAVLVTDPSQDRFDRYGRLLAYVYVGGVDVDLAQVHRGWAYTYIYEDNPFELVARFRRAQASAEREGVGVWGKCRGDFHSAEPGVEN